MWKNKFFKQSVSEYVGNVDDNYKSKFLLSDESFKLSFYKIGFYQLQMSY